MEKKLEEMVNHLIVYLVENSIITKIEKRLKNNMRKIEIEKKKIL